MLRQTFEPLVLTDYTLHGVIMHCLPVHNYPLISG